VINRSTDKPLSTVLDLKEAVGHDEPVYAGGPVARTGLRALLRSKTKLDDARPVLADIYVVTSKTVLERALGDRATVRVYFGYCGWGPGQLDSELAARAWHVMPGDPRLVFDAEPETVWRRLIGRTELRMARLLLVGGGAVESRNGNIVAIASRAASSQACLQARARALCTCWPAATD
jgi:putative transcriptional regulator